MSRVEVRQATAEDVGEIVDILSEAARWLLARGIEQWPDPFPRDRVEALARRGEFHVASIGGDTAAVFALLWSDSTFWGERPDDAGYVHALAVRRAYAGTGLGERLLEWVELEVAARGRPYVRLDCRADNDALRRYYERLGFEPRGEVEVDDFVAMRFERRCRTAARAASPTGGNIVMHSAPTCHGHAQLPAIRSQRERGWPTDPTQEGGGALRG